MGQASFGRHGTRAGTAKSAGAAKPEGKSKDQSDFDCSSAVVAPDPDCLRRLVEERIIPQLIMARRSADTRVSRSLPHVRPSARDVEQLARAAIGAEPQLALAYVEAVVERGLPLESVYLDLLAPAARLLGEWWTADACSFVDVTVGLWRLQQIIQRLGHADPGAESAPDGRRLLLVPEPGEQHTFGLIMLAGFFRRDGWYVFEGPVETRSQISELVAREDFAVVGLSIGCESRLQSVSTTIREVRGSSRNPSIGIMVGGAPFIGHPERVAGVGADCTAANAPRAVAEANRLFELQRLRQ
jgi:methanogenic corrinoid protein MtbC1